MISVTKLHECRGRRLLLGDDQDFVSLHRAYTPVLNCAYGYEQKEVCVKFRRTSARSYPVAVKLKQHVTPLRSTYVLVHTVCDTASTSHCLDSKLECSKAQFA